MKKFEKEDIDVLDFMVSQMLLKGSVLGNDLVKAGFVSVEQPEGLDFKVGASYIDEYIRYLHILNEFNVCECFFAEDSEFARKNSNTFQFQKQGGFKALYADLEEKHKQEKLQFRKAQVDLDLAERMLKEYPRTKWFARIGFFLGLILAIVEIIKWLTSK